MLRGLGTYVRRHHLALLALFVALGGTASAATSFPANIIGTQQLKNNAVIGTKVKNDSLKGADIVESTLDTVPSATNAAQLGGSPASAYQRALEGSCSASGAIHAIGSGGSVTCVQPVQAISAVPAAGANVFTDLGHGVRVATICHDGGAVIVAIQNVGSDGATLNWLYSDGTTVRATGVALASNTHSEFPFLGTRIEGQFIFANGAGNTTISLHAFDGTTFCEVRGTAQFGPNELS